MDDDPNILDVVSECLNGDGYTVLTSANGTQALETLNNNDVDLIIIDLGPPDIQGFDLIPALKSISQAGIIILSGRTNMDEKIVGLEIGADDYLTKPFNLRELLARVRSVLRQYATDTNSIPADSNLIYEFGGWKFNIEKREITPLTGANINLTNGEFDLLRVFVENPNTVLSRDRLLELTAPNDSSSFDRSIDIRIARIRKKFEKNSTAPKLIKTVRKAGYIFAAVVSSNT